MSMTRMGSWLRYFLKKKVSITLQNKIVNKIGESIENGTIRHHNSLRDLTLLNPRERIGFAELSANGFAGDAINLI